MVYMGSNQGNMAIMWLGNRVWNYNFLDDRTYQAGLHGQRQLKHIHEPRPCATEADKPHHYNLKYVGFLG